jgi:hypothetical protein
MLEINGPRRISYGEEGIFLNESFLETIPPNNEPQGNNEPYVKER